MKLSSGDRPFEDDLKAAFEAIRRRKGRCPNGEHLQDFIAGTLDTPERERVAEHIRLCGVCEHLAERLRTFDVAAASASSGSGLFTGVLSPVRELFRRPLFAYGVAVLTAILFAITPRGSAPVQQEARGSRIVSDVAAEHASVFDLDVLRSSEEPVRIPLPAADRHFILSFAVAARPGFRYSARIVGPERAPVLPQLQLTNFDALGRALVVCRRDGFIPGQYMVVIEEYHPEVITADLPASSPSWKRTERLLRFAFVTQP